MSVQRCFNLRLEALQSRFSSLLSPRATLPSSPASGCCITYDHHEESPELEEGHGEAQRGDSGPCHQQRPSGNALCLRQVTARPSPHLPISTLRTGGRLSQDPRRYLCGATSATSARAPNLAPPNHAEQTTNANHQQRLVLRRPASPPAVTWTMYTGYPELHRTRWD